MAPYMYTYRSVAQVQKDIQYLDAAEACGKDYSYRQCARDMGIEQDYLMKLIHKKDEIRALWEAKKPRNVPRLRLFNHPLSEESVWKFYK